MVGLLRYGKKHTDIAKSMVILLLAESALIPLHVDMFFGAVGCFFLKLCAFDRDLFLWALCQQNADVSLGEIFPRLECCSFSFYNTNYD